ncbi:MAG: hypothetical protein J1E96_06215 [Ruminococcus sp.]|nr:hypothetical protein [Ruminococcus sp.]
MRSVFESRLNIILICALLVLCVALGVPTAMNYLDTESTTPNETTEEYTYAAIVPETTEAEIEIREIKQAERSAMADKVKKNENERLTATKKVETATQKPTEKPTEKATEATVFATAAPVAHKASYSEQWDKGYLVAIDNPDKNYSCPHIELSDKNRELLERLCMGEYGTGGFTGAALIAQAVKNAMATYKIDDVATVIKYLHYDGRTDRAASESCKKAVVYIFDMDMDAVQHRILYMYNPRGTKSGFSKFHESQKYICNFGPVRFFDRK